MCAELYGYREDNQGRDNYFITLFRTGKWRWKRFFAGGEVAKYGHMFGTMIKYFQYYSL